MRVAPAAFAVCLLGFVSIFLASCDFFEDGSYFDSNTKQLKSDRVGRLAATGEDLRVYEFTPQSDPTRQCVFVAGNQKAGLVCWVKDSK